MTQLQALIFAAEGAAANDLRDGDSGCGADRVVRRRREPAEGGSSSSTDGKKRQKTVEMETLDLGGDHVWTWPKTQVFKIERILDKRMLPCKVGTVRVRLAALTFCPCPSA